MKTKLYLNPIFLLPLIVLVIVVSAQLYKVHERDAELSFKTQLEALENVNSVEKYFNYEGSTFVQLNLEGNNKLGLSFDYLDKDVFNGAAKLTLSSINNIELVCRTDKDKALSRVGVNLVTFLRQSTLKLEVDSVADLISNFNSISNYISSFPKTQEEATLIKMDNRVDENKDHWCFIQPLND